MNQMNIIKVLRHIIKFLAHMLTVLLSGMVGIGIASGEGLEGMNQQIYLNLA